MWVTVLASQPSVSMATETTQRMESPSRPGLLTVFMTSRSRAWSVMFSACWRSPVRSMMSRRALDLVGSHGAEIVVQLLARFELLAVDQQGAGSAELVAVLVEVAEEFQAAILQGG